MQITFDTTTITDDEVRGIFALLDTVRPSALAAGESMVEITGTGTIDPELTMETLRAFTELTELTEAGHEAAVPPVEVPTHDANGLPWDERIHASSKALNADGTWRTKRGVDKALVAEVEAELRATVQVVHSDGSTPPETVVYEPGGALAEAALILHDKGGEPAPENVEITQAPVDAYISTTHIAPPAPPAPGAPLAPAPTPTAPSPEPAESVPTPPAGVSPFVALMKRVTTAQGAGKLTQPRVKELLESLDKKSIMDLRTDEDALASFAVLLDGEGV